MIFSVSFASFSLPIAQDVSLRKLGAVDSAYWKSDAICLEGTRTSLLRTITNWANGIASVSADTTQQQYDLMCAKNIFWLYGLAGAGKSTVSNTVAKTLTADGLYLGCYFCARDGSERTSPQKVIPTIAYQYVFNPWGFSDIRDKEGEGLKYQLVTEYVPFGHGRHAWYVICSSRLCLWISPSRIVVLNPTI